MGIDTNVVGHFLFSPMIDLVTSFFKVLYSKHSREVSQQAFLPIAMTTLHIQPAGCVSQHFWHFMMGEFLPIMYVVFKNQYTCVHLYKDPHKVNFPLNSFYSEVCEDHHVTITISSRKRRGYTYVTPRNWDWHNHNEQHKLLWIVMYLKRWACGGGPVLTPQKPLFLVQDRQNASVLDAYYVKHETLPIRKRYGAYRRKVTNLDSLTNHLRRHYGKTIRVKRVCSDHLTLQQQIMQYVNAKVLVLGHGAGMVHMLWMQPKSLVVEIIPRTKAKYNNGAVQGCRRLCRILGFRLARIVVEGVHDVVRVDEVIRCLSGQNVTTTTRKPLHNTRRTRNRNSRHSK